MGESRRMLGAFGVEVAFEEIGDLLERERLSLVTGGDRVTLQGLETFSRVDRDQPLLGGEVEDIPQTTRYRSWVTGRSRGLSSLAARSIA
jgi:hypothetical protein